MKSILFVASLFLGGIINVTAQNLIKNGSFEKNNGTTIENWRLGSSSATLESGAAQEGNYYVNIYLYGSIFGSNISTEGYSIPVEKGKDYVATFWITKNTDLKKLTLLLDYFNDEDKHVTNKPVDLTEVETIGNWKKISGEVTIPDNIVKINEVRIVVNPFQGSMNIDNIKFMEKGSMAVADVNELDKVTIYPTVVSSNFTVKGTNKKVLVEVFNMNGQRVKLISANETVVVDTTDLENGVYIVRAEQDGKVYTQKIIKK